MLTIKDDLRAADVAAVRGSVDVVGRVTRADLALPTPCAGWDLAALLVHMTAQHRGFAAAAEGREEVRAPVDDDPVQRYAEAADEVLKAFQSDDVLERTLRLPDIERPVPGRMAIGFHLVDYLVHGWDVATTIGVPYRPRADVLASALPIVRAVPDGPERLAPESPFAPARPVPEGVDALTEILLRLGRDPN